MRKVIFIDWYETLCSQRMWGHLEVENPDLFHKIQKLIFEDNRQLHDDWLRGQERFCSVWHFLNDNGIPTQLIQQEFMRSLYFSKPDLPEFIPLIQKLRQKGYKVVIATDFFDIFGSYLYPYHHFDELFDGYISSAETGFIKRDVSADGKYTFFDDYLKSHNLNFTDCILIDNNRRTCAIYKELGMRVFTPKQPEAVRAALETLISE